MKVLQVARAIYPSLGGVELHVYNLARELRGQGHEVQCAIADAPPSTTTHERWVRLTPRPHLGRVMDEWAPEVVHVHGSRCSYAAAAVIAARKRKLKVVFTPHCFYPAQDLKGRIKRMLFDPTLGRSVLRSADHIISLTENDRRDALMLGATAEQTHIIPNSIAAPQPVPAHDVAAFKQKHGLDRYLLSVGRIDRVKRGDFLVRALAQVPEGLQLAFVGPDAGHRAYCEQLARELGVAHRVRFTGAVPHHDLVAAYQGAAAFVMASAYEGLPTVILEAMWLGTPVITAGTGGIGFLVRDNQNGFLYEYNHVASFAAAVERCLGAPQEALIRHAYEQVRDGYCWPANARRIAALYASGRTASGQAAALAGD